MDIQSYVVQEALILIPVLYVIGKMLKGLNSLKDKYIPFLLLIVGIALGTLLMGFNVNSIIQSVLVTGTTVYANQLFKQGKREE